MDLSKLDLGPLDADDDSNIEKYFVEFGEYQNLENKNKFVMVGVKGTGKSAVRKYLSHKKFEENKYVVELDDSYNIPSKDLKGVSAFEIKNRMESFIIKLIIQYLLKNDSITKRQSNKLGRINYPFFKKLKETFKDASLDFYINWGDPQKLDHKLR